MDVLRWGSCGNVEQIFIASAGKDVFIKESYKCQFFSVSYLDYSLSVFSWTNINQKPHYFVQKILYYQETLLFSTWNYREQVHYNYKDDCDNNVEDNV